MKKEKFLKKIVAAIAAITMLCTFVPAMADGGVTCSLDGRIGVPAGSAAVLGIPDGTEITAGDITVSPQTPFTYADGKITFTDGLEYDTEYTLNVSNKTFKFTTAFETNRKGIISSDSNFKTLSTKKSNFTYEQTNTDVIMNTSQGREPLIHFKDADNANNHLIIHQSYTYDVSGETVKKACVIKCTVRLDKDGTKTDVFAGNDAWVATIYDRHPQKLIYTFRNGVVEVYEENGSDYTFLGSKDIKSAAEANGIDFANFKFNTVSADNPTFQVCDITESDVTAPAAPTDMTASWENNAYTGIYAKIQFKKSADESVSAYKLQAYYQDNNAYKVFERVIPVGDSRMNIAEDGTCTIRSGIVPSGSNFTYRVYAVKEVDGVQISSTECAKYNLVTDGYPGTWTWDVYGTDAQRKGNLLANGEKRPLCINARLYTAIANKLFSGTTEYTGSVKMYNMKAVIAVYDISGGKCELTGCRIYDPATEPVMWQRDDLAASTRIGVFLLEDLETMKPVYHSGGGYGAVDGAGGGITHDYLG